MGQVFYCGLDLGKQNDYTAIAILERVEVNVGEPHVQRIEHPPVLPSWWASSEYAQVYGPNAMPPGMPTVVEEKIIQETRTDYHLVHLERPELGTSYTAIVEHVCALLARPPLRGAVTLCVDATGVGRPVVDMLRERYDDTLRPITITGGDRVTTEDHGREYHVPKRDLVATLHVLMQATPRRLWYAEALPLVSTFVAEAQNFQESINARGHDSYEAGPLSNGGREGAHDDLLLSVALPLWYAEHANGPRIRFFD